MRFKCSVWQRVFLRSLSLVICPYPDGNCTLQYYVSENGTGQVFDRWWSKTNTIPFYLIILLLPLLNFRSASFFARFTFLGMAFISPAQWHEQQLVLWSVSATTVLLCKSFLWFSQAPCQWFISSFWSHIKPFDWAFTWSSTGLIHQPFLFQVREYFCFLIMQLSWNHLYTHFKGIFMVLY